MVMGFQHQYRRISFHCDDVGADCNFKSRSACKMFSPGWGMKTHLSSCYSNEGYGDVSLVGKFCIRR
jgi:hypothetical protein